MNAVSEESSVLAGGYFYFTLDVYDSLGTAELETDFPGGRGVWRVRAEEDSAPWWSDDNYSVTANLYSAELAFNGWDWDDALLDYLVKKSYSMTYGARNLRRQIQKDLEDDIATKLIDSYLHPIQSIHASADGEHPVLTAE